MTAFNITMAALSAGSIILWGFPDLFKSMMWLYYTNIGFTCVVILSWILVGVYKEKK